MVPWMLRYRPPDGHDAAKFQQSLERRGATVRYHGARLAVEAPGVSEPEADRFAALVREAAGCSRPVAGSRSNRSSRPPTPWLSASNGGRTCSATRC
jgi:hypothetical protein